MRVVYTALFGTSYDDIQPITYREEDVKYVCFTDMKLPDLGWEYRRPVFQFPDHRLTARAHKVMSHALFPDSHQTMWHDATHTLVRTFDEVSKYLGDYDIATFKHPERNCVYDEAEVCRRLGKDHGDRIDFHLGMLERMGYPRNNGLAETSVVVRQTALMQTFETFWFQLLSAGSVRDQLSFDVAIWHENTGYGLIPGSRTSSDYFEYRPHRGVQFE